MFLRRIAQTAGAVAAVAFCAETVNSRPNLQRQNSSPEQQSKFRSFAGEVNSRAHKLLTDDDWKQYQTSKDIKVSYKRSPDHNGEVYRVEFVLDYPNDEVIPVLIEQNKRVLWDPDVKEYIIEELGQGIVILQSTYEVSGIAAKIMSPRDFCRIERVERHNSGLASLSYDSVEHPGCQELDGFVRAQLFTSGIFCEPCKDDPKKTRVVFIYQSDPKAYIPGYLLYVTSCQRGFEMANSMKKAMAEAVRQA